MGKLVAGGALCVALVGCGYDSAEYSAFDAVHLRVARDAAGSLALVELTVAPDGDHCRWTKVDLAWKRGVPTALLTRHHDACPV